MHNFVALEYAANLFLVASSAGTGFGTFLFSPYVEYINVTRVWLTKYSIVRFSLCWSCSVCGHSESVFPLVSNSCLRTTFWGECVHACAWVCDHKHTTQDFIWVKKFDGEKREELD